MMKVIEGDKATVSYKYIKLKEFPCSLLHQHPRHVTEPLNRNAVRKAEGIAFVSECATFIKYLCGISTKSQVFKLPIACESSRIS